MAHAHPVIPGATYIITRRTRLRELLLTPDDDGVVNRIVLFCVAWAARRHGVEVHALCQMSNHLHLLVTDVRGDLPAFLHWVFRHIACCMKARFGILDRFWDGRTPARQRVIERDVVEELHAYIIANPTAAGLVARAEDWPGAVSLPEDVLAGKDREVVRPDGFFADKGPVPKGAKVTLSLTPPPLAGPAGLPEVARRYAAAVRARLERRQAEVARKLRERGRRFAGAAAVKRTSRHRRAKGWEPFGELVPTFLARDAETRIALATATRKFRDDYRAAREAWLLQGPRARRRGAVAFPYGTWAMARYPGVVVAAPG